MASLCPRVGKEPVRPLVDHLEGMLCQLVSALTPDASAVGRHRGRPPILPATLLWAGVLVIVLRRSTSQLALWRLVSSRGLWHFPAVPVTDDAVYKRLAKEGPTALETLFAQISSLLLDQPVPTATQSLAPFATEVVALDETTLDPVARKLPALRQASPGSDRLLPGKLAGVFDVRRQLWRHLHYIPNPHQNEKHEARSLLASVPKGSMILADLGYFGFAWFDHLTDSGYHWVSRLRHKTSFTVLHIAYQDDQTLDAVVWLGAFRADRAKHAVRLVEFREGATTYRYITNVLDPATLSIREIAQLYQRRWDIELAVNLVKTHLGLHLLWSSKTDVILTQVWAVLIIAQVLQSLRQLAAERADVDPFDISLTLLIEYLPQYAARHADPLTVFIEEGRQLGFIRPSRRIEIRAPTIPPTGYIPLPPDLSLTRTPRYAHRQSSKSRGASN